MDFRSSSVGCRWCGHRELVVHRNPLIKWDVLDRVGLEDVQQNLRRRREVQTLSGDHGDEIDAYRDLDLGRDHVDGFAEEMLDRHVQLDPFEEGPDLPALAVDLGDRDGPMTTIEPAGQ